jgi:hypothetical protein
MPNVKRTPIQGKTRVYEVRKHTNEEIMMDALRYLGYIEIRVTLQIKPSEGSRVGYQGASFYKEFKSVREVREFREKLKQFIEQSHE